MRRILFSKVTKHATDRNKYENKHEIHGNYTHIHTLTHIPQNLGNRVKENISLINQYISLIYMGRMNNIKMPVLSK